MLNFTPIPYISLGPFHLSTHALMMVAGILIAYFLARREAKQKGFSVAVLDDLINWVIVGGIVGARLLYVLLNPAHYGNVTDIFKLWQGGLVSFGGVVGGFVAVLIFFRYKKIDWIPYADLLAPYTLLGWGIGRIGDFLAWEEFGTMTALPWGVDAGFGVVRHPVQLYTLLTMSVGFLIVQRLKKTRVVRLHGFIFAASGIYYFIERILMEFLRDDVYGAAQLVSYRYFAQLISLGLSALLLWWILRKQMRFVSAQNYEKFKND